MSYDLAAWYDPRDRHRGREADYYVEVCEGEDHGDPHPKVVAFLGALARRWPDRGGDDDTPWATLPVDAARGRKGVLINVRYDRAAAVADDIAQLAAAHDVTVYDPQSDTTWTRHVARAERPPVPSLARYGVVVAVALVLLVLRLLLSR